MKLRRVKIDGRILTVETWEAEAGDDYLRRRIFPCCATCDGRATFRNDGDFPRVDGTKVRGRRAPHFAHLPGEADLECHHEAGTPGDARYHGLSSGIHRDPVKVSEARGDFLTADRHLTRGGVRAGLLIAAAIRTYDLTERYEQAFASEAGFLEAGFIPSADNRLWRRKAPAWIKPFNWLLFHHVTKQADGKRPYEIRFELEVPEGSVLQEDGNWFGPPARLHKLFGNGDPVRDPKGRPVVFTATRENATILADLAAGWFERAGFLGHPVRPVGNDRRFGASSHRPASGPS